MFASGDGGLRIKSEGRCSSARRLVLWKDYTGCEHEHAQIVVCSTSDSWAAVMIRWHFSAVLYCQLELLILQVSYFGF